MKFISETRNRDVNFLLQPLNYTQLYNKLSTILPEEEIQIFAKPEVLPDFTSWSAMGAGVGKLMEFSALSAAQKEELADRIERLKDSINSKLFADKDFASLPASLFIIPDESNIKVLVDGNRIEPVFIQWGCSSALVQSTIDPLSAFLMRPRENSDLVSVAISYHTGEIAADKDFFIEYNERTSKEKTNAEGLYHRGRCKLGTSFSVYEVVEGKNIGVHTFAVVKGGNYKVVFPLLTSAVVKVMDQDNVSLVGEHILVIADGEITEYITDEDGNFTARGLKVAVPFQLRDPVQESNIQAFTPALQDNHFTFRVQRTYQAPCTIMVVDEQQNPVADCRLVVETGDKKVEFVSSSAGLISAGNHTVGSIVQVSIKLNPSNKQQYMVARSDNEFLFVLTTEPKKFVTVKLVDKKKRPMPGIKMDLTYGGATHTVETDVNGLCVLPYEGFKDKEKVRTFIHLPRKQKEKAST